MRILFITATRIGDAVISTGLLHHLVEHNPGARITVACGPLAASLFAAVPGLDRVLVLSKKTFSRHWFTLWNEVRAQRWDIVVDLRRSLTPYLLRADKRFRLGPDDHRTHRVELLSGLFQLDPPAAPKIWLAAEHRAYALNICPDGDPVIAICPVAARPEKTWPAGRFVALIQALRESSENFSAAKFLIIGAAEDRPVIDGIVSALPKGGCETMIGCPDLLQVAAVLSRCRAAIANDSGLAHLAAASGCPTVTLFGPTRPDLYRPWGMHVSVVRAEETRSGRVISDVLVSDVLEATKTVLD